MRIDFHEIKGTEQYLIFNGTKMELMCMEAVIILLQAKRKHLHASCAHGWIVLQLGPLPTQVLEEYQEFFVLNL